MDFCKGDALSVMKSKDTAASAKRFFSSSESLWKELIHSKYYYFG